MKNYLLSFLAVLMGLMANAQVNRVKEINDSGSSNSSPNNLFVYNGRLYFGADDSSGSNTGGQDLGRELWVTDGTEAGTMLVKDLRVGDGSSSPSSFFEYNGALYFSAQDGITSGNILFSSDGTADGTATTGGTFVFNPLELNGLVYYVNTTDANGLYQFDGTTQENVADVGAGIESLVGGIFTSFGNKLLCYMDYSTDEATVGRELYEYDPATDGFTLIKDITGDNSDASISNFTLLDEEVYFEALNGLWKTNGTEGGTVAVAAAATANIAGVNNLYAWNGLLFFEGDDGTGDQLWKYDPVADEVTNLSNIAGTNNNHDPGDYAPAGGFLYYSGEDADDTKTHLWRTDGMTIEQLDNTIADVDEITVLGDMLIFEGDNGMTGNELYGYSVPTTLVTELQIAGEASMFIGATQTLSVSALPDEATDQTVTWSSSNTEIATIDETGLVTAVNLGMVEITAIANDGSGITDVFSITISPVLVQGVTVSGDADMLVGATQTLSATITPENATDKSLTWSSNDTDIATVDQTGLVNAVSVGMVEITATANDGSAVSGTFTVTVSPVLVNTITLLGESEMEVGEMQTLTATITPENATDKSVTWTSGNSGVASVDQNGLVTALSSGSVTITATANDGSGVTSSIMINVSVVLSLEDRNSIDLELMPNPAENYLEVRLGGSYQSLPFSMINTNGKTVLSGTLSNTRLLDVSSFERGLYLLRIEKEKSYSVYKFVLR
ncbi:MAG: Ig-like domain-containing protein [Bacteroidota bacterium]